MRIGVDLAAAVNQRAGIGRYARGVLSALAAETTGDWFLGVAPQPNDTAYDGPLPRFGRGRTVTLPISERHLWIAWQRLRLPLPPDLLSPRLDVFYNPDFLLPRLAYAQGVCTVHDLGFITVPECSFPNLREHLLRAVPWSLRRARRVVAVSEHTKRDLVTLLGVPAERIHVAGNAPDGQFCPVEDVAWRAAERARLAVPERFLLAVGTLEPRKNLVRLFEALALMRHRGYRMPLVVAGREGWLYEPIYRRVEEMDLRECVRFLPGPSDRDLMALYNLCDVMVFPSLYEGFGVPPLEALACGAVVVSSNAASLPEVLGDAALFVDPYDVESMAAAIARAIEDLELRRLLRARGPAMAARYTWAESARRVRAALREATS